MRDCTYFLRRFGVLLLPALAVSAITGCRSPQSSSSSTAVSAPAPTAQAAPAAAAATPLAQPKAAPGIVRIRAGDSAPLTDAGGHVWLADQGFADGETILREGGLKIENTQDPALYRAEHYSMSGFSYPVPNGKYTVKLHFAETFEEISGPGQRVFDIDVEGHPCKDFDIWAKAGGRQRAYVETVPVDVADGKLDIKFVSKVQNPAINGIEIIPAVQ